MLRLPSCLAERAIDVCVLCVAFETFLRRFLFQSFLKLLRHGSMIRPERRSTWLSGLPLPYPDEGYTLTTRDVAGALGCSVGAVHQLVTAGRLSVKRVPAKSGPERTHNRYHPDEIAAVAAERAVKPYRTTLDPEAVRIAVEQYRVGRAGLKRCAAMLGIGVPRFKELLREHNVES